MEQLKEQVLLFMEEVEARELHQIEQSLGEIHILHDDYPNLAFNKMHEVVHALGHVLRVLMNVLDSGSRELLRDILFEDGAVMPLTLTLTLRNERGEKMDRCLFVRGMARFEFKYREFQSNSFHFGTIGDPSIDFNLDEIRWNMREIINSTYFLICYCSFFTSRT